MSVSIFHPLNSVLQMVNFVNVICTKNCLENLILVCFGHL